MTKHVVLTLVACSLLVAANRDSAAAADRMTNNVVLITIDGLRWQDLFTGADRRHSYPGYNEILCGFGDEAIDSNAKRPNPNVTVLEWLNQKPSYQGRVAAFGSWDVFPYILNQERSGIYVNAGWQDLEVFADEHEKEQWNRLANSLPRVWSGVRYDAFTARGALEYLHVKRPRVLYVALGETDDWAHDGRYDLYLEAAATVAALLGEDFTATDSRIAQAIGGTVRGRE